MCTQALATGKDVQTDCSVNATIKGKTYCFGTLAGALVLGLATAQPNVLAGGLMRAISVAARMRIPSSPSTRWRRLRSRLD